MTLCDPMDCNPPDSSLHGIIQIKILEWISTAFSRGSSIIRDRTQVSHNAGRLFTTEPPGKPFSDLLISVCGDTCDKLLGVGFCLLIILDVKFWEGAVSGKAVFRCHEVEPV